MDERYRYDRCAAAAVLVAVSLAALPGIATAQEEQPAEVAEQPAAGASSEEEAPLETIPVESLRAEESTGDVFPEEGPHGFAAKLAATAGYDSNAAATSNIDRGIFFDLAVEETDSSSPFVGAAATLGHRWVIAPRTGWINSVAGEGKWNPEAHFADSVYLTAASQLRWSTGLHRVGAGLVYTSALIDEQEANHAAGVSGRWERLTGPAVLGISGQIAGWRFPDVPVRDVDSTVFTLSLAPPSADSQPVASFQYGWDTPKIEGSPFGRDLWGADGSVGWEVAYNVSARVNGGYLRSEYDDERKDDRFDAGLVFSWRPARESGWQSSCGLRLVRNASTEPAFDVTRVVFTVELAHVWAPAAE